MPARGTNNDERADVLGLTGGIGSGKSLAAAFLARRAGWRIIDADQICRESVEPEAPGWKLLGNAFGARFFHDDQTLNRTLLRQAIFNDPELRAQVNSLLHPLARQRVAAMVAGRSTASPPASGAPGMVLPSMVLVEVPLLFEAGWERDFSKIIVVYADPETCRRRLAGRDSLHSREAAAAIAAQWPLHEKVVRADHVIDNSGCPAETYLQLLHLVGLFSARCRAGKKT